jgi:hypothetical protein
MLYQIPIGVEGGAWPYRYQKITGPSWLNIVHENLTFNAGTGTYSPEFGYGVLSGTAPATPGGPDTVTVRVTDMLGNTADVTFGVTVATTNFVHVDQTNGSDISGDGSLANPFQTVYHVNITAPATNKIVVVHGSTYTMPAHSVVAGDGWWQIKGSVNTPSAYISSAGQMIDVDCSNARRAVDLGSKADAFVSGFNFINCGLNDPPPNVRIIHAANTHVDRSVFWNLRCANQWGGTSGTDNPGFIILFRPGVNGHNYVYIADCVASDFVGGPNGNDFYTAYNVRHGLIERNTMTRFDGTGGGSDVIHLKGTHRMATVRANLLNSPIVNPRSGIGWASGGDVDGCEWDFDICYNRIGHDAGRGAISCNNNLENFACVTSWNAHIYRNSLRGSLRNLDGSSLLVPEAYATSNVCKTMPDVWTADTDNVVTGTTDPFDANMNLTGSYRTSYLGIAGAEITAIPS